MRVVCAPTPRLLELLARHAVDLALVSVGNADEDGVIRREPLVWVGKRGSGIAGTTPLPLALGAQDALDHQLARRALDAVGRDFRLAYASSSLAGLIGMARSGLAVTVLTRTAVPDDLEVLGEDSGLPPLPDIGVTLAIDRERPSPLTAAFAAHVRKVLPAA